MLYQRCDDCARYCECVVRPDYQPDGPCRWEPTRWIPIPLDDLYDNDDPNCKAVDQARPKR
jgi:hypothetical protein